MQLASSSSLSLCQVQGPGPGENACLDKPRDNEWYRITGIPPAVLTERARPAHFTATTWQAGSGIISRLALHKSNEVDRIVEHLTS